ncbi:MAG: hypothetical protein ACJARS_001278 [bacterium]|jgi:hypothetical protein
MPIADMFAWPAGESRRLYSAAVCHSQTALQLITVRDEERLAVELVLSAVFRFESFGRCPTPGKSAATWVDGGVQAFRTFATL